MVNEDQDYVIAFAVSSADERYDAYEIEPIAVTNIDVDDALGNEIPIRIVAGNITSGK